MSKPFIKFFDKIVILLLGVVGVFTGCKSGGNCSFDYRSDIVAKYGMPMASYVINGKVTNKTTSKPIPNIRIIRQINENYADTLYTDIDGKYVWGYNYLLNQANIVHLKVEDIDGEENGGDFASKEINIKITYADKENMEKCKQNGGKFVKTQNIELKKKQK